MNRDRKSKVTKEANVVSWVITAVLLGVNAFPVGLFFLIAKLAGHDIIGRIFMAFQEGLSNTENPDSNRSSVNRAGQFTVSHSSSGNRGKTVTVTWESGQDGQASQPYPSAQTGQPYQQRPAQQRPPLQGQYSAAPPPEQGKAKKTGDGIQHISNGKKALFILGWVVLALGILGGIRSIAVGSAFWRILQWIAVTAGSIGMLYTARTKDKKERLYQNIVKIVGDKAYVDIKALASAAGIKEKNLVRELDEMLERGYFPASAYLDMSKNILVLKADEVGDYTPTVPQTDASPQEEDKYDLLLKEMDRACGRITDRDMLEKSVQVRGLAAAIFHAVREDPEKQSQIGSFLNYYFPTTLKLLDSYADFEEKGYQGEKLTQTRERIASTMDTIIAAYRKQLDNLYLPDTMDVDTDIDVLETMLKRDGLSGSDFTPADHGEGEGTLGTMN